MQCTWRGGLVVLGVVAGVVGPARSAIADSSPDKVAAAQLVALVNEERAAAGVAPLGLSPVAIEVAEGWSVHMAATGVLAHNDAWFSADTKRRAGAAVSGENVAYNMDLLDAHRRLMDSPQHRANILDARFHELGVGVVRGGDGTWWITEDFLQLRVVRDAGDMVAPAAPPPSQPQPPPASPGPPARPSNGPRPSPVGLTSTARRAPAPADVLTDDGEIVPSPLEDAGGELPEGGVGIEVASGRRVAVTPAARGDVLPPRLAALAAAGVLVNAAGLAAQRRRRLMATGKGDKITHS